MDDPQIQQALFIPAAILAFLWGLIWGSFFNVCIYRIPMKKSVVHPGSHCYSCGVPVKWYDNIPVISYLMLGGNCRHCGTHFSSRYLFVELFTGLMFLAVFLVFGLQWQTPFQMVFVAFLIVGTFTDIDHFIIPDRITIGGTIFAIITTGILGLHSFMAQEITFTREFLHQFSFDYSSDRVPQTIHWYTPLLYSLIGAAFGYGLLWCIGLMGRLLFRKEAMGMGDVKLFAFLGAWMGPLNCVWILFLSAFVGALLGISLLIAHRLVGKDEYETLTLPDTPTVKSRWLIAKSQLAATADESPAAASAPVELSIPRRTSRQLHHFPYGPYIALAAVIVLLFHQQIHRIVLQFLNVGF